MTRFRLFLIALAVLVAIGAVAAARHRPEPRVKVGTVLNRTHPTAASLLFFQQRLGELSDGRMPVDVFFNSQLGGAGEVLELCRMGDVEMTQVSVSELTVYLPMTNALAMPFIWRDSGHQQRALDGEVGRFIRARARRRGIEIMGFFDAGTRNVTTSRGPVGRPEDLRGMKIRVMSSPLMVATINALGGSAVALNMGEVYTALQMGVIDGWENNPMTVVDFRMYETGCKYFAWTRHFSLPDLMIAGQPFLDRLTPQERAWLDQAVAETIAYQRRLWRESEEKALAEMAANGMTINEVESAQFRARVRPLYEEYYRRYGPDFEALCERIGEVQ